MTDVLKKIDLYNNDLNEMSDETFEVIKKLGKKIGFKVYRTNNIFYYLKKAGKRIEEIIRLATLYGLTDIGDSNTRHEIEIELKKSLKNIDKSEIADFFIQLDKSTFGLTSIPRNTLSYLLGIKIDSNSKKRIEDIDYINKNLKNIKEVLIEFGERNNINISGDLALIKNLSLNINKYR